MERSKLFFSHNKEINLTLPHSILYPFLPFPQNLQMLQQLVDTFFALWLDILHIYIRVSAFLQAILVVASDLSQRDNLHRQYAAKVVPDSPTMTVVRRRRQQKPQKAPVAKPQTVNYINELPNEILLAIFEMAKPTDLPRCTVVCRRWHVLVTPILWRAPVLIRPVCCLPPSKTTCRHPLQKGMDAFVDYQYRAYSNTSCPSSSSVWSPSSALLSKDGFCEPARLSGCQQTIASDSFPIHLEKYGTAVRKLVLPPKYTTDCSVRQIVTYCPNITHLVLDGCIHITDITLLLLAKCQTIESLSIRYCNLVTDTGLLYLSSLPRLQELYVTGLNRISCDGVTRLAPLRCLDVSECSGVTAVRELVRSCGTALTHLSIARLNVKDLESIVEFCPNLVYLNARRSCSHRAWRSDDSLIELIESFQRYTDITLSHYYRRRISAKQQAELQDQQVFDNLVSGLSKLKYIDVTLWNGLMDHKVQQTLHRHGQLAGIAVAGCRNLSCRAFGCKCRTARHGKSTVFNVGGSSSRAITVKGLNHSGCKHI